MSYDPEHGISETLLNMQYAYGFEGGQPSGESGICGLSLTGEGGMPAYPDTYYDRLNRFTSNQPKMSDEDFMLYQNALAKSIENEANFNLSDLEKAQSGDGGIIVPSQSGDGSVVFGNSSSGEGGMPCNYGIHDGFQEGGQGL